MAKDSSFDIVSDYDIAKVTNAVEQTQRDIAQRYDFKGTSAGVEFVDSKTGVKLTGDNQFHLDSVIEILRKRLAGSGVDQKVIDASAEPQTSNMQMSWTLPFKKGLNQDNAKKITKLIRDSYPKVKTQVQGEEVRVSSAKRDELQAVIQLLKQADFDFPLEFTNYR
ncbi:YajQ family cyclic di-GMP-binding protein [Candidatus Saccharibacteria bacterium]|nr:YajQ family cyclic di-GMP-binding protein [Candidatus Saccharibacteria bacterium]